MNNLARELNVESVGVNLSFYQETPGVFRSPHTVSVFSWETSLSDFGVVRYMNWMMTNGSNVVHKYPDYLSSWDYSGGAWNSFGGVPLEFILDTVSISDTTPWINIPHLASDEAILDMGHRIFRSGVEKTFLVEFSNETWNWSMPQFESINKGGINYLSTQYDRLMHTKSLLDTTGIDAKYILGSHFYGYRDAKWYLKVGPIPKDLPGVDAIAVGPYMGTKRQNERATNMAEMELLMEHEWNNHFVPALYEWADIAHDSGVPLIAYESGLHIVGPKAPLRANIDALEDNRSEEAAKWCTRLVDEWNLVTDNDILCWFNLASRYHGNHAWGLIDTNDMSKSHKFYAIKEYL